MAANDDDRMNAFGAPPASLITAQLQWEIEQFLYAEAALLDERRHEEWFALAAEDLHYCMPVKPNMQPGSHALPGHESFAHFEETKSTLRTRLKRINTGLVLSEEPPPRVRRFVSNVRITSVSSTGECEVQCLFILHRVRLDWQNDVFHGARTDTLRRAPTALGWQIARRIIHLDPGLVPSYNLNTLF
jgi:3-phenylpropionate/cinnamic acid dioxygenase small subunit